MKKSTARAAVALTVIALAGLLAIPTVALSRYGPPAWNAVVGTVASHVATPVPANTNAATVNAQTAADLAYMREEEKLAHDVYTTLAQKWGTADIQQYRRKRTASHRRDRGPARQVRGC